MTRDDIIRAGQKVGLLARTESLLARETLLLEMLERFAALVASHELEACAAICDSKVAAEYATGKVDHNEIGWTQACAAAIRARGGA